MRADDTDEVLRSIDDLLEPGVVGDDAEFPDGMRWQPPPEEGEAPFDPTRPLRRLTLGFEADEITDQRHALPVDPRVEVRMAVIRIASGLALTAGQTTGQRFLTETAPAVEAALAAIGSPNPAGNFEPNMRGLHAAFAMIGVAASTARRNMIREWAEQVAQRRRRITEQINQALRITDDPYTLRGWAWPTSRQEPQHPASFEDLIEARRHRNTGPTNPHGIDGRARRRHHPTRAASDRAIPRNPEATHGTATPESPMMRARHAAEFLFQEPPPGFSVQGWMPPSPAIYELAAEMRTGEIGWQYSSGYSRASYLFACGNTEDIQERPQDVDGSNHWTGADCPPARTEQEQ